MNTWFSSRLAHLPKQGIRVILMITLLATVALLGTFSSAPTAHAEANYTSGYLTFVYSSGNIPLRCSGLIEGAMTAPEKAENGCSVRIWLYHNSQKTGTALCLSPHTNTGTLHRAWVFFWVSSNKNPC